MSNKELSGMRRDYRLHHLDDKVVQQDPFEQFAQWFEEVERTPIGEVNAMTLSTAGNDGKVSSRMVLLKSFGEEGFTFFTNYRSRKSSQLEENPNACINFFWFTLERQVKIEGTVSKVSEAESDAYFASRPRGSQLAAHVSERQSGVVPHREYLEKRYRELEAKYDGKQIPRPPYWGGYLLTPEIFEFWQGRPYRLHDRIEYIRDEDGNWHNHRLSP